jgi:hypothetical protein
MVSLIKIFVVLVLVAFIAVLLTLLMPTSILLEFFLILVGMLLIAEGCLVIAGEVGKVMDLRHRQRIQQELRELQLQRVKYRQILLGIRYRRANRGRSQY